MAKILIPTPLRQFTAKQDTVTVSGATVGEVLAGLITQFPDLRKQIFTEEGKIRSFVNVYLNDEDIRYLGKDATPAADSDTLSLVPSIAGGWDRRSVCVVCRSSVRQGTTDHGMRWSVPLGGTR